jgi:hypothetical protein
MLYKRRVVLGLLTVSVCLAPAFPACADPPLRFSFDFRDGVQGWEAGFADYYAGQESEMELEAGLRELPEEIGEGTGFWLHGNNHSDDLFMYLKRRLGPEDGIQANQRYRVRFVLTFASNAPSNCMGIGGPPGEAVTLKAGATPVEPLGVIQDDGSIRMNVDKGNQAAGGPAASVVGNIANGIDCDEIPDLSDAPYVSLQRMHWHEYTVESNKSGELWLLVGTDSGFEGTTALYYQKIIVSIWPAVGGSTVTQPLDASSDETRPVGR